MHSQPKPLKESSRRAVQSQLAKKFRWRRSQISRRTRSTESGRLKGRCNTRRIPSSARSRRESSNGSVSSSAKRSSPASHHLRSLGCPRLKNASQRKKTRCSSTLKTLKKSASVVRSARRLRRTRSSNIHKRLLGLPSSQRSLSLKRNLLGHDSVSHLTTT